MHQRARIRFIVLLMVAAATSAAAGYGAASVLIESGLLPEDLISTTFALSVLAFAVLALLAGRVQRRASSRRGQLDWGPEMSTLTFPPRSQI